MIINRILWLFLQLARVGSEGSDKLTFIELVDRFYKPVCSLHLQCKCTIQKCPYSHRPVVYDRCDIQLTHGYLCYEDFATILCDIFDAKFYYKMEILIQALYNAYAKERIILHRKVTNDIR